jgi:very-short-patch-repair endonuclease
MRPALSKRNSTKAERLFAELLKKHHIPFVHRHRIKGKEVDFIIGRYAVEIDGHPQSSQRNQWLVEEGYLPLHFGNRALRERPDIVEESIIKTIKPSL